jgi:nicotinic acid phosphoribosyltransferase
MKYQLVITLGTGEVVKSQVNESSADEYAAIQQMMEYAAKAELNYMKFRRDTGNLVYLSKETINTIRHIELVEFPETKLPTDGTE